LDVDLFCEQEAVLNLLCIYKSSSFPPPSHLIYSAFSLCFTICFSAKASKDKDQCKCENLVTFQNYATSEVRKLTQRHILSEYCFLHVRQGGQVKRNGNYNASSPYLKSTYCNEKLDYLTDNVNLQDARLLRLEICLSFIGGTKILIRILIFNNP